MIWVFLLVLYDFKEESKVPDPYIRLTKYEESDITVQFLLFRKSSIQNRRQRLSEKFKNHLSNGIETLFISFDR